MYGTMSTDHQHNIPFGCNSRELVMERRWNMKSNHTETAPNCPRCASSNTKFCYYNNYSLSQPRYFCKGCRRYWTKGGSLRNVPVGGGCRKSRKSKSARLAADQRQSLSYQMPSPGSTSTNTDDSHGTSAANIDLAAVFANFLNQDSSSNNDAVEAGDDEHDHEVVRVDTNNINVDQESSSSGVSYNSLEFPPTNRFDAENHHLGNMLPYDHFVDGADHHMFPPLGPLDQDCDSLNLQAILGDEEIGGEEILPNFEWQSMMQFQDFGSSFSSENDLKNIASNDMVTDDHDHFESWNASYDLSPSDYHWNNCN